MDNLDLVISMAERVKRLRTELQEAELELEKVVRGKSAAVRTTKAANRAPTTRSSPQVPVSQRVAKYLAQHPDGSEFGVIVGAVQPASKFAVKSALKGMRDKGTATFRNGKYAPKENASRGLPRRRQVLEQPTT